MLDFNFSNAGWLVIAAVVFVIQALAIWAVYLIVRRSYRREIAGLEAEISALNERLRSGSENVLREASSALTGVLLSILFAIAVVYLGIVLFPDRPPPPPPPQ